MKRWWMAVTGIALFLTVPATGHAQEPWSWDLTPHVGLYRTPNDLGPATPVSQVHYVSIREVNPSVSLGLQADLALPMRGLALSLRGLTTLPSKMEGGLNCFPGYYCVAVLLPVESEVQRWGGSIGLLYRPWQGSTSFRPYMTAGIGLLQERYRWPEQENGFLVGTDRAESSAALMAGVGFELTVGPVPLRLEVTDIWTPEGDTMESPLGPSLSSAWPPRRGSRHDLNISLGWVLGFG